ncbi:pseudouridine synthase [Xylariaceae sp. FL0662B]|nr:pseudouridine synthase [Xylariaceae sp. FL0662B]
MDAKGKYLNWTRDSLIQRIQSLEAELRTRDKPEAATSAAPTSTASQDGGDGEARSPEPSAKKKKGPRKIDPSRYSTRLVAFKLAYIGKNYSGFEFQVHANMPTIEEELWKACVKACLIFPENPQEVRWDEWEYSKCGRTDRGVSAFGQVIALRVRSNRPLPKKPADVPTNAGEEGPEAERVPAQPVGKGEFDDFVDEIPYCRALNRLLPPDIRMLAWCPTTPAEFSARHNCRERQYRYFFTQPAYSPLPASLKNPKSTTRVKDGWLDIDAMRDAAKRFEGLHDFRNFCKIDPSKNMISFERRIFESDVVEVEDVETALPYLNQDEFRPPPSESGDAAAVEASRKFPKVYYIHVRGSAFLWHQIRCMAAVLFMVGQGLEEPSVIDRLLDVEAEPKRPNYVLADEAPLVLWDCIFPDDDDPERKDALGWAYIGEENPLNQHCLSGLVDHMWEYWRERKIDEVLASQLLNLVSFQADITLRRDPRAPMYAPLTQRVFEGGNRERWIGKYQPVLQRARMLSPDEVFDRDAKKKGYESVVAMREAIAKKKAGAVEEASEPVAES